MNFLFSEIFALIRVKDMNLARLSIPSDSKDVVMAFIWSINGIVLDILNLSLKFELIVFAFIF